MLCWWHTVHTPWPYVSYEWNQRLPSPETQFCGWPDIYLGAKLKQTQLPNGVMVWGLSPSKYVVQAVKNCQLHLSEKLNREYLIPARADNLFPVDYDPSTDLSGILDPECSSFYQHLIGVMRWMVELRLLNLGNIFAVNVKVIYHLWVYWDSSVVFSHHAFIAFGGNLLAAGLSSFAILFPSIGFLLAVGHLVSNCDLRCIIALVEITAYLAIVPSLRYILTCRSNTPLQ